jgi:hypothetical protein
MSGIGADSSVHGSILERSSPWLQWLSADCSLTHFLLHRVPADGCLDSG